MRLAGPTVRLAPKEAEILTLAIHELATNASKYGGLRQPDGRIDVTWAINYRRGSEQNWLELRWRETGCIIPPKPNRPKGFGTELIRRRVLYELNGEGTLDLDTDGVRCLIKFPLGQGESTLQTDIPLTR